ncbi:MAG TPA: multicopper oxidase domain-containing protein [Gemmatimonadaceae bacterium]|nr:multicopper oxidase domain-containing protein [Gemmatimonadaceae bacterium]
MRLSAAVLPVLLVTAGPLRTFRVSGAPGPAGASIAFNDNRSSVGTMRNGELQVHLEVDSGDWRPYGADGPALRMLAFREVGKPLQDPGPMLRVVAGTRVHAWVTNHAASTLVLHGFSRHHQPVMDTLVVAPGATREVTFTADEQGTFYYWGSTTGADFADRLYTDDQLNGALIVDPADPAMRKPDRVFVISWYLPGRNANGAPDFDNGFFVFNGRPWPNTERLSYQQGDSIRWRFINATADVHPLHLHGFFFRVNARGDEARDTVYWQAQQRMGVTELMDVGTTMDVAWMADRPGAWIFHCHLNWHVVPNPRVGAQVETDSVRLHEMMAGPPMATMDDHMKKAMGGLMLALNITPRPGWHDYAGPSRHMHLYIVSDSARSDTLRRFGYELTEGNQPAPATPRIQWPGPTIVLHRGQPTTITVVNRSPEPSQVHWHGLEIESYYDGVAGLSSNGSAMAPMIMPGDSFQVHVTPPRAGSFMYHTHVNDVRQQSHGLYGAIVVLDSGETWNPDRDRIVMVSTNQLDESVLDGGSADTVATLIAGEGYRLRLMNISLDDPFAQISLERGNTNTSWLPLAKDGYPLPEWQRMSRTARQLVSIGETYDMQVKFSGPTDAILVARGSDGHVIGRQRLHVVAAPAAHTGNQ